MISVLIMIVLALFLIELIFDAAVLALIIIWLVFGLKVAPIVLVVLLILGWLFHA